jgi:hypothetical protein
LAGIVSDVQFRLPPFRKLLRSYDKRRLLLIVGKGTELVKGTEEALELLPRIASLRKYFAELVLGDEGISYHKSPVGFLNIDCEIKRMNFSGNPQWNAILTWNF